MEKAPQVGAFVMAGIVRIVAWCKNEVTRRDKKLKPNYSYHVILFGRLFSNILLFE